MYYFPHTHYFTTPSLIHACALTTQACSHIRAKSKISGNPEPGTCVLKCEVETPTGLVKFGVTIIGVSDSATSRFSSLWWIWYQGMDTFFLKSFHFVFFCFVFCFFFLFSKKKSHLVSISPRHAKMSHPASVWMPVFTEKVNTDIEQHYVVEIRRLMGNSLQVFFEWETGWEWGWR